MHYQKEEIRIINPLSFWQYFKDEERIFFYNPIEESIIIGAKSLKIFHVGESNENYPFVFVTKTFFPEVKDSKWENFGNETIAFETYLHIQQGQKTLYYAKNKPDFWEEEDKLSKHEFVSSLESQKQHIFRIQVNDYPQWQELFTNVKQSMRAMNVKKVVISREVPIVCDTDVDVSKVIKNLLENNPQCFIYAYAKEGKTFLGATPELLVQKEGELLFTCALAGTIPRRSSQDEEEQISELLHDLKNRKEHQMVVDQILHVFKTYGEVPTAGETRVVGLKNLFHLYTPIEAKIQEGGSLIDWMDCLHPTPALGGYPVRESLAIIAKHEKHERGLYAAPIGIVKGNGEGVIVVGIRSALIKEEKIYAYCGCGIVEGSECEKEYLETNNKLRTILESLY